MPLIPDEQAQTDYRRFIGADTPEQEDVPFSEILAASFRLDNTIGSFLAQEEGLPQEKNEQNFNA